MASYSDSATPLAVYLDWESKDANGDPVGTEARKKVFTNWVTRMMMKTALREKAEAEKWVAAVITPNGLTSVHELAGAANIEYTQRSSWVTTWQAPGVADPLRKKLQELLRKLTLRICDIIYPYHRARILEKFEQRKK